MESAIIDSQSHRAFRYGQVHGRRKLHLVEMCADGTLVPRAVCGYSPDRWRVTFNVPLNHVCRNCLRHFSPLAGERKGFRQQFSDLSSIFMEEPDFPGVPGHYEA